MKVIIIGGGQVGSYLASLLISNGHQIHIIENRESAFKKLEEKYPHEILTYGSGTDPNLLEQSGISTAEVVAAVTGYDEVNLVISTLAKMEFGVPRVVARVNNPKNNWLFNSGMGVDVGVNQADLMAHFIVEEMNLRNMFTLLKINRGKYSIVHMKVEPNAAAANHFIKDLSIPNEVVLIAITRDKSLLIPRGETQILVDDEILAFTNEGDLKKLEEIFY